MKKHIKKHLPKIAGLATVALIGFVGVSSGILNNKVSVPRIDSISPAQGPEGTVVTLVGSGFTTQADVVYTTHKDDKKEDILLSGNSIKIEGKIISSGIYSVNGTSLEFKLDLNNTKAAKECTKKLNNQKDCKIGLKVVNMNGKESNEVHFLVTQSAGDTSYTPGALWASILWPAGRIPLDFHAHVLFSFDSNTISQVKSFRVYEKIPEATNFSLVAEFSNPAPLVWTDPNSCSPTITSISSQWQLQMCQNTYWRATSEYLPLTSYPNGRYDFYVTAVDSAGVEHKTSDTMTDYVLGRATVTSPTANQITSTNPTITYAVAQGWPLGVGYEVHFWDVSTGAWVSFFVMSPDPTTQTTFSFPYSGSPYGPIFGGALIPGRTYYVEAQVAQEFPGRPTYQVLPDGAYFTIGN